MNKGCFPNDLKEALHAYPRMPDRQHGSLLERGPLRSRCEPNKSCLAYQPVTLYLQSLKISNDQILITLIALIHFIPVIFQVVISFKPKP